MAVLKIKLKSRRKIHIKKRTSQIRAALMTAISKKKLLREGMSLETLLTPFVFLLEPNDAYTSTEPFREGTLYVEDPDPALVEVVLAEVVRWVEEEEGFVSKDVVGKVFKSQIFTQFNYDGEIRNTRLKSKLKKLFIFNRFKYLDIDGRVTRCLKVEG